MRAQFVSLCAVFAIFATSSLVLADVTVTQYVYLNKPACDGSTLYTLGPTDLSYVSCNLYARALGNCSLGQCCDSGNGLYIRHLCTQGNDAVSCTALRTTAMTACGTNNLPYVTCLDSTPGTQCCGALLLWESACADTTITPSLVQSLTCSFNPSSATAYYDAKCGSFNAACAAADTVIGTYCLDSQGCADTTPSTTCCNALRGITVGTTGCSVPETGSCGADTLTYEQVMDWCDGGATPSSSPSPSTRSTAATVAGVRSCTFDWVGSPSCSGDSPLVRCSTQPDYTSCDQYNTMMRSDYYSASGGMSCDTDRCCVTPGTTSDSFMWTCHDSTNGSERQNIQFMFVAFAILLSVISLRL